MNSVSESLYMAAPMVLYPQTGEQAAVARRAAELGAGVRLKDDSAEGIRAALREILEHPAYAEAARKCSEDFRRCSGPAGAAEFIENAPHDSGGDDVLAGLNRSNTRFQVIFRVSAVALSVLLGLTAGWGWGWGLGIASGIAAGPLGKLWQKRKYAALTARRDR